ARRSQYRPRERAARGAGPGPAAPLAWLRVERPGRVLDGPAGLPRVLCGGRGAAAAGGLALAPGRAPPAPAGPVPGGVLLLPPAGGLHLQPPLERAAAAGAGAGPDGVAATGRNADHPAPVAPGGGLAARGGRGRGRCRGRGSGAAGARTGRGLASRSPERAAHHPRYRTGQVAEPLRLRAPHHAKPRTVGRPGGGVRFRLRPLFLDPALPRLLLQRPPPPGAAGGLAAAAGG